MVYTLLTRHAPHLGSNMTRCLVVVALLATTPEPGWAASLHERIDHLIEAGSTKISPAADDGEFVRRAMLDFAGRAPTVDEARSFIDDKSSGKRAQLIDRLLASPDYAQRMADFFNVHLMERLGDNPDWSAWLRESFAANKKWDVMAREILRAEAKGASFFFSKRLENYGQNPVDYSALTRDVGRLFLGKNLQCAECHDHLFVNDYKQKDFQGLYAFIRPTYLVDAKLATVAEKPIPGKTPFMSVFKKQPKETGPALPGGKEHESPVFAKGEEYEVKPDPKKRTPGKPKFSTLALLSETLPTKENADFARNIANRLWFMLMGRGVVHPLDLHHSENPPSVAGLLEALGDELVSTGFDVKHLLREIALSRAYQRSSVVPEGEAKVLPESFRTAIEKRISAEQMIASIQTVLTVKAEPAVQTKIQKAFANAPREPEDDISPSLKGALFVLNDPAVLAWFEPTAGNLVDRLSKLDDDRSVEEMYLAILARRPSTDEVTQGKQYLQRRSDQRVKALGRFAWSLLASSEFSVNH